MSRKHHWPWLAPLDLRFIAALLAAGSISACSVMRIDVDVYKGPLANHEEVQTQELTALAVGAHPLLTELRDTMEWDHACGVKQKRNEEGLYRKCIEKNIQTAQNEGWYDEGYARQLKTTNIESDSKPKEIIGTQKTTGENSNDSDRKYATIKFLGFKNNQAIRANKILSLYEDTYPKENSDLIFDIHSTIKKFEKISSNGFSEFNRNEINDKIIEISEIQQKSWIEKVEYILNIDNLFPRSRGKLESLARYIARSTYYPSLALVLEDSAFNQNSHILKDDLKQKIDDEFEWPSEPKTDLEYRLVAKGLERLIVSYPRETATELLAVNDYLLKENPSYNRRKFRKNISKYAGLAYVDVPDDLNLSDENGSGVTTTPQDLGRAIASAENTLNILKDDLRQGLERGRLDDGIWTLTEKYFKAKKTHNENCPPNQEERRAATNGYTATSAKNYACRDLSDDAEAAKLILTDALARFATKVLIIANNDVLLTAKNTAQNMFSDIGRRRLDRFVLVLQSIGNAILVQTDELRRVAAHKRKISHPDQYDAEMAEIRNRFAPPKSGGTRNGLTVYGRTNGSRESPVSGRPDTRDALDKLITALRYSEVEASLHLGPGETCSPTVSGSSSGTTPVPNTAPVSDEAATPSAAPTNPVDTAPLPPPGAASEPERSAVASDTAIESSLESNATEDAPVTTNCLRLENVRHALKIARQHRSGMVYIRPPSAYLRTSLAASGLQGDPRLGWENSLWNQFLRSLPGFGQLLVNDKDHDRLTVLREIDKQFWQNINSIRVSGSGTTNYVLVKDDIGNWYVKGYSADPEAIFSAAQSTALFSMGGKLNANLLRQRNLDRRLIRTDLSDKARATLQAERDTLALNNRRSYQGTGTGRGDVLDAHVTAFVKATDEEFSDLEAAVRWERLSPRLDAGWRFAASIIADPNVRENFTRGLEAVLGDDAVTNARSSLSPQPPEGSEENGTGEPPFKTALKHSEAIRASLERVLSFRQNLQTRVGIVENTNRRQTEIANETQKLEELTTQRDDFAERKQALERERAAVVVKIATLNSVAPASPPAAAPGEAAGAAPAPAPSVIQQQLTAAREELKRLDDEIGKKSTELDKVNVDVAAQAPKVGLEKNLDANVQTAGNAARRTIDEVLVSVLREYLSRRQRAEQSLEKALLDLSTVEASAK